MKIVNRIDEHETMCVVVEFDNGSRLVGSEKAVVEIAPDGVVVGSWWKEEPQGRAWYLYLQSSTITLIAPFTNEAAAFGEWCWTTSRRGIGQTVEPTPPFGTK